MKEYKITEEWNASRLDRFVKAVFPELSFSKIQMLARKGRVKLNGKRAKGSVHLKRDDIVSIYMERMNDAAERRETQWKIGSDIAILYEDSEIIVIDKPAGIPVHPGNRKERGSILDALREYQAEREQSGRHRSGDIVFPYSPVHRLDIETTGALLIAKTRRAARTLSEALREGGVKKIYLAVVSPSPAERSGVITTPIVVKKGIRSKAVTVHSKSGSTGNNSPNANRHASFGTTRNKVAEKAVRRHKQHPGGQWLQPKSAKTFYAVKKRRRDGSAVLEVRIETGRTHQIRAHLASIGSPIVGDRRYGTGSSGIEKRQLHGPLHLHSWQLVFHHPASGELVKVKAPVPW